MRKKSVLELVKIVVLILAILTPLTIEADVISSSASHNTKEKETLSENERGIWHFLEDSHHYMKPNSIWKLPVFPFNDDRDGDGVPWTKVDMEMGNNPEHEWFTGHNDYFVNPLLRPDLHQNTNVETSVVHANTWNSNVGDVYGFKVCSISESTGGGIGSVISTCTASRYIHVIAYLIDTFSAEMQYGTKRNVKLSWELPEFENCNIDYYNVFVSTDSINSTNYQDATILATNIQGELLEYSDTTNVLMTDYNYAIGGYESSGRLIALSDYITPSNEITTFTLSSPEDNQVVASQPISFTWENVDTATYELILSENSDYSDSLVYSGIADTTFSLSGLVDSTYYYWKVYAIQAIGDTLISDQTQWRFGLNSSNSAPSSFSVMQPTYGSTLQTPIPYITWEPADDPGDNVYYDVIIGYDASFDSVTVFDSLSQNYLYVTSELPQNIPLYLKIKAFDSQADSTSNIEGDIQFTFDKDDKPTKFSKIFPHRNCIDGDVGGVYDIQEVSLQPTFSWQPSMDLDNNPLSYYLIIDTTHTFETSETYIVYDTTWTYPGTFTENEEYYWDVYAVDADGDSTKSYGLIWSFCVNTVNDPPEQFNLISPTDIQDSVSTTFTWEKANDPDPNGTPVYDFYLSSDSLFTNGLVKLKAHERYFHDINYIEPLWLRTDFNAFQDSSWYCGSNDTQVYGNNWLQALTSKKVILPLSFNNINLTFKHKYNTEPPNWDGGAVLISINNGIDWEILYPAVGSYDTDSLWAFSYHAQPRMPAYCGDSGGWVDASFDLTPFAGDTIQVKFLFASDEFECDYEGWHIDDIQISGNRDQLLLDDGLLVNQAFEGFSERIQRGKTYYWKVKARDRFSMDENDCVTSEIESFKVKKYPSVSGYAFFENGTYHLGIEVKLVALSPNAVSDTTYTDTYGFYEFLEVIPGLYRIEFSEIISHFSNSIENIYCYPRDIHNESITLEKKIISDFTQDVSSGLFPLTVQFTDTSFSSEGISQWEWNFDNDEVIDSYLQNPDHTYDEPGYYSVSLKVTDVNGVYDEILRDSLITAAFGITDTILTGILPSSDSPYFIYNDVVIPDSETLIIEPGVTIYFQENFGLIVRGQLLALGTKENPIRFTNELSRIRWGGIIFDNVNVLNDSSKIIYSIIEQSQIRSDKGGGLFIDHTSKLLIKNSIIQNNDSGNYGGGGLYLNYSDPIIENNTISFNNAYPWGGGGGLMLSSSSPKIINNNISNNYSYHDGGGLSIQGNPELIGNTICNNQSYNSAGGLIIYNDYSPIIINNTICNNHALYTKNGGGLYIGNNCYPEITNCIIRGNYASFGSQIYLANDGNPNIQYCNVQNGYTGIYNYTNYPDSLYQNNIDLDPKFIDPTTEAGSEYYTNPEGWALNESSPCIDAGDPTFPTDPDGTIADMGAYYFDQILNSNFSAEPTQGYSPLAVQFTDISTGGQPALIRELKYLNNSKTRDNDNSREIVSWEWDFDNDGTIDSYEQNPLFTYTEPGLYTVTLTVSDGSDTDVETKVDYIIVGEPLLADFEAIPTEGLLPLEIQFTDLSTGGLPAFLRDSNNLYNSINGKNDNSSEIVSWSKYFDDDGTEKKHPTALRNLRKSNMTNLNVDYDKDFEGDNSREIVSWYWDFDSNGTIDSNEQNPLYTYQEAGIYTVSLIVNDGSSTDTEIKVDYIVAIDPIIANFEANPTEGFFPLSIQFTDLSFENRNLREIISWEWDFDNDGTIDSNEQNPFYTYTVSGTYTISLTVSDGTNSYMETKFDYITVLDENAMPYWVDNNLDLWTKVSIPAQEEITLTLKMDSGYSPCGEDVFLFFDDFNSTELDLSKWEIYEQLGGTTYNQSNGILNLLADNSGAHQMRIRSINLIPINSPIIWDFRIAVPGNDNWLTTRLLDNNSSTVTGCSHGNDNADSHTRYGFSQSFTDFPNAINSQFHTIEITYTNNEITHKDITTGLTKIATGNTVLSDSRIEMHAGDTGGKDNRSQYDFQRIRNYIAEEPIITYNIYPDLIKVILSNPSLINIEDYEIKISGQEVGINSINQSVKIKIYEQLVSNFSASPSLGIVPLTVNFADLSSGDAISWEWDFGDSGSSIEQNPIYEYINPGIYNISLTVTDEYDSTDTETKIDFITVCGSDPPASPTNVQVDIVYPDAVISWTAVDTTIYGDPIVPDGYVVSYSENENEYFYLWFTTYTEFTHEFVAQYSTQMFYQVATVVNLSREEMQYLLSLNNSRNKVKWSDVKWNLK